MLGDRFDHLPTVFADETAEVLNQKMDKVLMHISRHSMNMVSHCQTDLEIIEDMEKIFGDIDRRLEAIEAKLNITGGDKK